MANLQKLYAAKGSQSMDKNLEELKRQNENYSQELTKLKSEMDNYQSQMNSVQDGQSLIDEFKAKIKSVRAKMRALKREAYLARVSAQDERDRSAAVLGNNGYVIKDGQVRTASKVEEKSYTIDVKLVP